MKLVAMTRFLLVIIIFLLASCASPARYRVLIVNNAEQPLECSGYFYNNSEEIVGKKFDTLFDAGKKANIKNGEWVHINLPTITNYKYFWVGIKKSKGEHWVFNEAFEEYGRNWFDISEGLRIDYLIQPNGDIRKSYWH